MAAYTDFEFSQLNYLSLLKKKKSDLKPGQGVQNWETTSPLHWAYAAQPQVRHPLHPFYLSQITCSLRAGSHKPLHSLANKTTWNHYSYLFWFFFLIPFYCKGTCPSSMQSELRTAQTCRLKATLWLHISLLAIFLLRTSAGFPRIGRGSC